MTEVIDAVKLALKNEIRTELFFRRAAELTERDDSRMVFAELAELEEQHVEQLAGRISGSSLSDGFDAPAYVARLEETMGTSISADDAFAVRSGDVKTVIRLAEAREANVRDDLLFLAREADDTGVKILYTALSQLEDEHLDELKRMELAIDMPDSERPSL
jgi:rubrerythrin